MFLIPMTLDIQNFTKFLDQLVSPDSLDWKSYICFTLFAESLTIFGKFVYSLEMKTTEKVALNKDAFVASDPYSFMDCYQNYKEWFEKISAFFAEKLDRAQFEKNTFKRHLYTVLANKNVQKFIHIMCFVIIYYFVFKKLSEIFQSMLTNTTNQLINYCVPNQEPVTLAVRKIFSIISLEYISTISFDYGILILLPQLFKWCEKKYA